ncbi:MAG TPA: transposase [Candidatus Dormibacteraeota bacterium]|nr:transposase [Candidatus Dormibacteraeota bacterium]
MFSRKTFKFRLYPNRKQQEQMLKTLDACREIYNAGLQERIGAWKCRTPVNYNKQQNQLPEIKEIRTELLDIYSHALQDPLRRLDKAFQAFFRRCKSGQTPGFPRFKGRNRFDSFTYPDGFKLTGAILSLSKIGNIKVKLHRPVEGKIKSTTIKRKCGAWYATLSVEFEPAALPSSGIEIGVDVGLESFAVLSNGMTVENPRWYRNGQAELRKTQPRVTRREKGSKRRRKAVLLLQKAHARITNQRNDFHHKVSCWLVENFGTVAVEDLNIQGLAGGLLSKSVQDAGWASFFSKLSYKAANAGRTLIAVHPPGTSQTCVCGATVRKLLSDREHVCGSCGLIASRDHVSAQVILQRAGTLPSSANVEVISSCVA